VPLSQIARIKYQYEEPILWRRNRDLVLNRAWRHRRRRARLPTSANEVEPKLKPIEDALPYGIGSRPAARSRKRKGECVARGGVPGHGGRNAGDPDGPVARASPRLLLVLRRAARYPSAAPRRCCSPTGVRFVAQLRHDRASPGMIMR
jgi:hypothetical protein